MATLLALRDAAARFIEDQGFVLASALSFAGLLCLAPLTLLALSAAGFLLASDTTAEYLFDGMVVLLPAYGTEIAEFFALLGRQRAVTGVIGTAGLMLFATQLSAMLRTVLNRVFRVPGRPLARGVAFDLVTVGLLGAVAVIVSVGIFALTTLAVAMEPGLPFTHALRRPAFVIVVYALAAASTFAVYAAVPNTRVPWAVALKGTLVVALLWEAARRLFAAYVAVFGVYGKLYGSLGIGVAGLVWLYYSAIIFVLGAELVALGTIATRKGGGARWSG